MFSSFCGNFRHKLRSCRWYYVVSLYSFRGQQEFTTVRATGILSATYTNTAFTLTDWFLVVSQSKYSYKIIFFIQVNLLKKWYNHFKETDCDYNFFCQRSKPFWGSPLTTCPMLLLKKYITACQNIFIEATFSNNLKELSLYLTLGN